MNYGPKKITYGICYYPGEGANRTTQVAQFDRLKDARSFVTQPQVSGYVMRFEDHRPAFRVRPTDKCNATLLEFFGGFTPSPTEQTNIDAMVAAWRLETVTAEPEQS